MDLPLPGFVELELAPAAANSDGLAQTGDVVGDRLDFCVVKFGRNLRHLRAVLARPAAEGAGAGSDKGLSESEGSDGSEEEAPRKRQAARPKATRRRIESDESGEGEGESRAKGEKEAAAPVRRSGRQATRAAAEGALPKRGP